jgi:hypothetical protein
MTDRPPLHDFSRSHAVVTGDWEYAYLESDTAVRHGYECMVSLLTAPLCGWLRNRLTLENAAWPGDLANQLIAQFEDPEGLRYSAKGSR